MLVRLHPELRVVRLNGVLRSTRCRALSAVPEVPTALSELRMPTRDAGSAPEAEPQLWPWPKFQHWIGQSVARHLVLKGSQ